MAEEKLELSTKDERNREFILSGNLNRVIFVICGPIALYQSLNQIFKILDTMMAAHIDANSVSAVAYISQLQLMLAAVGGGLAIGGGIKIAEFYGAGRFHMVKRQVNTLLALSAFMGLFVLVFFLPFTEELLRFAKTPEELIMTGKNYFKLEIIAMVIGFFNNIYIAIERARGNSKVIFNLNIITIIVKLGFTAYFVYVIKGSVTMIALASLFSQLVIFIAGIYYLRKPGDVFGINPKSASFKREILRPILSLSFPVMMEKLAFTLGKVVVNAMSTLYGTLTVGALGISNSIGGLSTNPQGGFQDGGASIISQNIGAKNYKRSIDAFHRILVINVAIGFLGYFLTMVFLPQISGVFAKRDPVFQKLISDVYLYEAIGAVPLGITAAIMALLYGYGYTKLTLVINFARVFIFRIPVLYYLQNFTQLGSRSVGVVMMVSNVATGVMSILAGVYVVKQVRITHRMNHESKEIDYSVQEKVD